MSLSDLRDAETRARTELTAARAGGNRFRMQERWLGWLQAHDALVRAEGIAALRRMELPR